MANPLPQLYFGGLLMRPCVQRPGNDLNCSSVHGIQCRSSTEGGMDVLGKAHEIAAILGHVTTYDVDGRFFATKKIGGYVGLYGGERECSGLSLD